MLIKLLPKDDKEHMLELASLMAISDKPILWDDKIYDEITSETNLELISIKVSDEERELITELENSAGISNHFMFGSSGNVMTSITNQLIEVLKKYSFTKMEKPSTRVAAATSLLLELLKQKKYGSPFTAKIILYELFLVALRDGNISGVEWALLKEFQRYQQLEDFIFNDLLERAEALNQEISETISIILE